MPINSLTYFGLIRSISSWAKVARELLTALAAQGVAINIYERRGFLYDSELELPPELAAGISKAFKDELVLTFEHPSNYRLLPKNSFNIGMLVYEFTRLPKLWAAEIEKNLSLVLVPSEFCRSVFIESGVPDKKVCVLRYGFNPTYYWPRTAEERRCEQFTFLTVGSPHRREGLELLLRAYRQAFRSSDAVRLLLKLSYLPRTAAKSFELSNWPELLEQHRADPTAPVLQVIDNRLTEGEMGALYRRAAAYISLTRGEAFGLPFLEALASGLPVIAPNWGGQLDYLNSDNARLLNYSVVNTAGLEYEPVEAGTACSLPDVADAAANLLLTWQQGARIRHPDQLLRPDSTHWHWASVAGDFVRLIDKEIS